MVLHSIASIIAGFFSILASILSTLHIREHLLINSSPEMTKYCIRILGIVPLYAFQSWFGLMFTQHIHIFDMLREIYEALVVYSFFMFLVCYFKSEDHLEDLLARKGPQYHIWPLSHIQSPISSSGFLQYTKIGILQYAIVRPFLTILSLCLHITGVDIMVSLRFWVFTIVSCSQTWAIYCLVLFYLALFQELQGLIHPLLKFICIKAIVFATFWQGVLIESLASLGVIHSIESYPIDNVSAGFQDFFICIEMLLAALTLRYAFPAKEFQDPQSQLKRPIMESFLHLVNYQDMIEDVQVVVRQQVEKDTDSSQRKVSGYNNQKNTQTQSESIKDQTERIQDILGLHDNVINV